MPGRLYVPAFDPSSLLPDLRCRDALRCSPNMAPRRSLSILRSERGETCLRDAFWGLTPPWLEVLDRAPHCARAESLTSRHMFREAFSARRCLVPAGGVYLWKPQLRFKQPFLVVRADRGPLLLAGLWCRYHTSLTEHADSMALITVPANALLAPLGDRLPAVVPPEAASRWLDPDTPEAQARALLTPPDEELLGAFPVSRRVNDPANQDPACAHPTGPMLRWPRDQER
ncbi:SOS response-associated peptidase [Billgrantia gudaonensis]|uniref:Abasic site processing protein n=1 Tax=Billgrantia gudaonensis TaxID=376427 RepID=A0A1G8RYB2_9GAMM|nr:SOS response-associated peptidase [Halomonas gudaonensis]SDJ21535.1 Putative SOS response-associated peptidase YedK [Halomonas gudaonensis]